MGVRVTTEVPPSLEELKALISKAEVGCFCKTLLGDSIDSYDHTGGITVQGHSEKQWVYFPCPKCGHEWSLNHLLNKIQVKYTEANF